MSRSWRHTPRCGITTAESEKSWKQQNNRKYRHKIRQMLNHLKDADFLIVPHDFSEPDKSVYGPKDGKQIFDPSEHVDLMRK